MPSHYGGLLAQAIAMEEQRRKAAPALGLLSQTPPRQKGILESALEQGLPMDGRAAFLPFQDTLPGSVMNERQWAVPGMLASAWNAFTAPERARTGFLDPMSAEGVEEAMNVAGMAMLPGVGGVVAKGPTPSGGLLGANVYHGSPYKFDAFDSSKIGTGEGAQAYGHGLYFAENPNVAKSYAQAPTGKVSHRVTGEVVDSRDVPIGRMSEYGATNPNLYKVDLPDESIGKMLDWNKPLSQQSEAVRKVFEPMVRDALKKGGTPEQYLDYYVARKTGEEIHALLRKNIGNKAFAKIASENGIPGIRYLDQGSRTSGKGTYNYVVFPGEEKALKILSEK